MPSTFALTKCQSIGGYLLQIETQVEQTWLNETGVCIPTPEFNIVSINSTLGFLRKSLSEIYGVSRAFGAWWIGAVLDPSTRDFLWVNSGIASEVNCTHCSVMQTRLLSYHRTTCNSRPLHIPNANVAFAFRGILLIGRYSLCPIWVYSGSTLVNPE
uniref:Uncharacterized protein n=1 Tax=Magallana gigas TaxID=29159 RepID=K1PSL0_MAGGI